MSCFSSVKKRFSRTILIAIPGSGPVCLHFDLAAHNDTPRTLIQSRASIFHLAAGYVTVAGQRGKFWGVNSPRTHSSIIR
jgi:hypothetical protein